MAILKNDEGLIQLHTCPQCNYLVAWNDTVNDKHLCKWCAAQQSVQPTKAIRCACGGKMLANYRCQSCGIASPL